MKKVITYSFMLPMTFLIGCSFSKNSEMPAKQDTADISLKELTKVNDLESAIKFLPEENVRPYFKDIPSKVLNSNFASGKTAIEVAVERGNPTVLRDLLNLGASPYVPNKHTGINPLEKYLAETKPPKNASMNSSSSIVLLSNFFNDHIKKAETFLRNKNYSDYLADVYEQYIPCDRTLSFLIKSGRTGGQKAVPLDFLQKITNAPSCSFKFSHEKPHYLFLLEFKNQSKDAFQNIFLLEFISTKLQSTPSTVVLSSDNQRKIFASPAALLLWSLKDSGSSQLAQTLEKIHKLSKLPNEAAIIISAPQNKTPSKEDVFIRLEELFQTQDKELLGLLKQYEELNSEVLGTISKQGMANENN